MTRILVQHFTDQWPLRDKDRATAYPGSRGDFWHFEAKGHATGAPEVCGGISALLCALAEWLETESAFWNPVIRMKPGDASISFIGGEAAGIAAELTELGLRQIAEACPEAVSFERVSSRGT